MSMINSIQIKGVTHELPSGASAVVEGTDLKIQNGNTVSSVINPAGFTYSNNEMVVGKWIDGRPVYRIVGEISDDADIIQQISPAKDVQGYIYNKGLIPILTSNTSAADTVGTAIRSDCTDIYDAWRSYRNDRTTSNNCWYKNSKPCWLGFHFNNPVVVKSFFLRQEHDSPEYIRGFIFQASNDGEDWIDLGEYRMSQQTPGFEEGYSVDNGTEYTHYRWYFNDGPSGGISVQLAQMYDFNIFNNIYEYTKKSDAPNSFTPAMLDIVSVAAPKHAYSTEEQVVGTWIDGKPVYESIIDLGYDVRISSSADSSFPNQDILQELNCEQFLDGFMIINDTKYTGYKNPIEIGKIDDTYAYKAMEDWTAKPDRHVVCYIKYTKTTD